MPAISGKVIDNTCWETDEDRSDNEEGIVNEGRPVIKATKPIDGDARGI